MPNWCSNTIKVTGPKEDLERFLEAAKSTVSEWGKEGVKTDLSLGKLHPIPKNLLNSDGWYDWCNANFAHVYNGD